MDTWNNLFELKEIHKNDFIIKLLDINDLQNIFELLNDADVVKYLDTLKHENLKDTAVYLTQIITDYNNKYNIPLGIYTPEKRLIGFINLHSFNFKHRFLSFTLAVHKNYWGKKMVKIAFETILNGLFQNFNFHRIEAQVHIQNIRSLKFLQKFGFEIEGIQKENFLIDNNFFDCYALAKINTNTTNNS